MPFIVEKYAGAEADGNVTMRINVSLSDQGRVNYADQQTWRKTLLGQASFMQHFRASLDLAFGAGVSDFITPTHSAKIKWSLYEKIRKDPNRSYKLDKAWKTAVENAGVTGKAPPKIEWIPGVFQKQQSLSSEIVEKNTAAAKKIANTANNARKAVGKFLSNASKNLPNKKDFVGIARFIAFVLIAIIIIYALSIVRRFV